MLRFCIHDWAKWSSMIKTYSGIRQFRKCNKCNKVISKYVDSVNNTNIGGRNTNNG